MYLAGCRGFVYATAVMGVTGARATVGEAADGPRVARRGPRRPAGLRRAGVSTANRPQRSAGYADGVIVGSALVRCLTEAATPRPGSRPWASSHRTADGVRRRAHEPRSAACCTAAGVRAPVPDTVGSGTSGRCRSAYALCILAGIIVAVWLTQCGSPPGRADRADIDIAAWAVPFGIIGGRIYHVITDNPQRTSARADDPWTPSRSTRAASASGAPSPWARSGAGSAAASQGVKLTSSMPRLRAGDRPGDGPLRQLVQQ